MRHESAQILCWILREGGRFVDARGVPASFDRRFWLEFALLMACMVILSGGLIFFPATRSLGWLVLGSAAGGVVAGGVMRAVFTRDRGLAIRLRDWRPDRKVYGVPAALVLLAVVVYVIALINHERTVASAAPFLVGVAGGLSVLIWMRRAINPPDL